MGYRSIVAPRPAPLALPFRGGRSGPSVLPSYAFRLALVDDSVNAFSSSNPPASSEWESVLAFRRRLVFPKPSVSLSDTALNDTDMTDIDVQIYRWIFGPLAAQTIPAQAIRLQIRALEASSLSDLFLAWKLRIVKPDGTDRGVLVAMRRDDTELATTLTNRGDMVLSTAVTTSAYDLLVLELGVGGDPLIDHDCTLRVGSASTDLPEDDTSTADLDPWLGFEQPLVLDAPLGLDLLVAPRPQGLVTEIVQSGTMLAHRS